LDFQLSQGSVATYCRCGGNLCGTYVQNFPTNQLVKEFRKSVHICQSYYQTSKGYTFFETVYEAQRDVLWDWHANSSMLNRSTASSLDQVVAC